MIDNEVTNLCDKTLSKLNYYFVVMLYQMRSTLINMLCFLKILSMHILGIFKIKSDLINMW